MFEESVFADFDFKKRGGNSNFRLLKELIVVQEKLEQKVRVINTELLELNSLIVEIKQAVINQNKKCVSFF